MAHRIAAVASEPADSTDRRPSTAGDSPDLPDRGADDRGGAGTPRPPRRPFGRRSTAVGAHLAAAVVLSTALLVVGVAGAAAGTATAPGAAPTAPVGSAGAPAGGVAGDGVAGGSPGSAQVPPGPAARTTGNDSESAGSATSAGSVDAGASAVDDGNGTAVADRSTTVLWRGFRHVWSYNHRFNRFGSWVDVSKSCDREICDYEVGHSGASGSGEDKAAVRDAYTELSAANVDFDPGSVSFDVEGTEKTPKGGKGDTISRSKTVRLEIGRDIADADRYAVVLNGFDMKKVGGASSKVIDFELSVSEPRREDGDLVFTIDANVLLDCDSFECKGPLPLKKLRGGKFVQAVDYKLEVQYLAIGGDAAAFAPTRTDPVNSDYSWDRCLNNKVENPFTDVQEDDKWGSNFFPGNRMNCERSTGRELQYSDFTKSTSIRSAGSGYEVGTVGIKSLSVNLDHESHFTQYDTIVGGDYRGSEYRLFALPFFKEWSSRPGQFSDARFAYGFKGGGSVSVTPVLLEFARACERDFVNGGGIHWEGGGADPTTGAATVTEQYRFGFGDHWQGASGHGSLCDYRVDPLTIPDSPTAKPAFWVPGGGSLWNEFGSVREDPTKLRGGPGDRYYSGEQENAPVDTAELTAVRNWALTDDDGDGNFSEVLYELDADFRYDDPVDDTQFGDPVLTVEYRRASGGWMRADRIEPIRRDDKTFFLGPEFDEYTDPPEGTFTHMRLTLSEGREESGPRLDRIVVPFPEPVRFERVDQDRVVDAYIDSNPSGAEVFIDGKRVGTTPIDRTVPAGQQGDRLRLVLKKDGYQPRRARIVLGEGDANRYVFDLYRPDKPIVIRSTPNASVWFDGARVGTTPFSRSVPPGTTRDVELRPLSNQGLYFNQTFENVSSPATINATLPLTTAVDPDLGYNYTLPEVPEDGYEVVIPNGTNGTDGTDGTNGTDGTDGGLNGSIVVDYPEVDAGTTNLTTIDPDYLDRIPNVSLVVANASVPDGPAVFQTAVFDAGASYSLAGSIDRYRWSFGDGTTATGREVEHAYNATGTYDVTLTVVANGTTAETTETVTVSDRPPRAAFSVVDPPVESGELATFDASASVDPDGNVSVVHWEMGDGVRWTGERINHTYTSPGNYTVTVRVVDENGNAAQINRTVRVEAANDPPVPALSVDRTTVPVGEAVSLDAGGSTDPDGTIRRYEWQLDNGATAVGETLEFAFSRPGRHDVTLVVVDDDGDRARTTRTVDVVRSTETPTATATATRTPEATATRTPEATETATDPTATETATDPTATETATDPTATETATDPTATATAGGDGTASTTTGDGGESGGDDGPLPSPGFGPVVAVLALLAALLAARRRA